MKSRFLFSARSTSATESAWLQRACEAQLASRWFGGNFSQIVGWELSPSVAAVSLSECILLHTASLQKDCLLLSKVSNLPKTKIQLSLTQTFGGLKPRQIMNHAGNSFIWEVYLPFDAIDWSENTDSSFPPSAFLQGTRTGVPLTVGPHGTYRAYIGILGDNNP